MSSDGMRLAPVKNRSSAKRVDCRSMILLATLGIMSRCTDTRRNRGKAIILMDLHRMTSVARVINLYRDPRELGRDIRRGYIDVV